MLSDNKRRWLQQPFPDFLSRVRYGNAWKVGPGDLDPPLVIPQEVRSEEVLNLFLKTRPELADRQQLFAELLNGADEFWVKREVWQELAAAV